MRASRFVTLAADGLRFHIPRGYMCVAFAFRMKELSR